LHQSELENALHLFFTLLALPIREHETLIQLRLAQIQLGQKLLHYNIMYKICILTSFFFFNLT